MVITFRYFYSLHYLLCHTNFTTKFKLLLLRFEKSHLTEHKDDRWHFSNIEASYFSLEINTIIGYLLKFGCDKWEFFESWANSSCAEHISLQRDHRGFEIEADGEAPHHCRRGTPASSVALQVAHWTIVLNLLWQFWRRSQNNEGGKSGEKNQSKPEEEISVDRPNKSKSFKIKASLDDKLNESQKSLEGLPVLQRILINLNQLKKVLINQNQL